jgi:NAD(P)-dependent dehydrogenase (short-subunit alcohol dehydrogenase family)
MPEQVRADIDSVALDAPLQFQEPSQQWINQQSRNGVTGERVEAPEADLTGKWIIVTGGNSGIGREAALQLAAFGANVFIAAREDSPAHEPHPSQVVEELQERAKQNGHPNSEMGWYHVDYADLESVEAFAKQWLDTGRPLDALANNVFNSPYASELTVTDRNRVLG